MQACTSEHEGVLSSGHPSRREATRDLIVATIAIWVSVAIGGRSVAIAVAATVCASWAIWAICVGSKLLGELLLLSDGLLNSGLLGSHVILVLLLLSSNELLVLRLLSLHELLTLGLGLVEG